MALSSKWCTFIVLQFNLKVVSDDVERLDDDSMFSILSLLSDEDFLMTEDFELFLVDGFYVLNLRRSLAFVSLLIVVEFWYIGIYLV